MKVTVDLPDWIVKALLEWHIPEEYAGPTIEDRLYFLADSSAMSISRENDRVRRLKFFRALGIPTDDEDDDDISF